MLVIHCAAWTAVDAAEDEDKKENVRMVNASRYTEYCRYLQESWTAKWCTSVQTMYLTDREQTPWQPDCKEYAPLNVYG